MGVSWKTYHGKQVLYCDYSGLNTAQMIKLLYETCEIMKKTPEKMPLLTSFENTTVTSEFMNEVKRLGKEVISVKAMKTALLGVHGIREIMVQGYILFTSEKNLKIFQTEQAALDWVVSE
jgi:hypothetical protein